MPLRYEQRTRRDSQNPASATVSWRAERPVPETLLRLAADENFNSAIVRGVMRRNPGLDLVTVQDSGLSGASDEDVLAWAADEDRVFPTHDVTTMTEFAYERIDNGLPMPGIFEVSQALAIGAVIDDISLLAECSLENEWSGQVLYLPL